MLSLVKFHIMFWLLWFYAFKIQQLFLALKISSLAQDTNRLYSLLYFYIDLDLVKFLLCKKKMFRPTV
jgi:hypothetical protein